MKKSEKFIKRIFTLRKDIEKTLEELVSNVKYRYVEKIGKTEVTPEGFIELNKGIVHIMHDSNGNLNEVICGIHTDMKKCQTDCQGEVTDNVWLHNVSNECLVAIIKELEEKIDNPEMIEIQTGDEY